MSDVKIPMKKTAIVLIEPQNDFLSPGGTMFAHIKEQLADRHDCFQFCVFMDQKCHNRW